MENKLGVESYELEHWLTAFGSRPVDRIAHEDLSADYEMTAAHVFELENGQYALVTESGCSCYSSDQADIELFPGKAPALEAFEKWKKENAR